MINSCNKKFVNELFNKEANHYFAIPKYQREYTWGYNEWEVLFDDLSENQKGYFIGSIIYINTNDALNPRLEVIDGQQRLTTMSLLLAAIYTKFKQNKDLLDEDDLDEISTLKKALKSKNSENQLMLVPQVQNSNLGDYNSLMHEIEIGGFAKRPPFCPRRKIYRCYNYFLSRLQNDIDNLPTDASIADYLMEIKGKVMSAMLVCIEVSSHSDAYVMFESLNHRGTPLTAIDLMKNLIMAKAERAGLTCDECFEKWQSLLKYLSDNYAIQERFFRHYYNAFKNRLNAPFRKDDDRKKDPLGIIATKSNLLPIYEKLINRDLPEFLDDVLESGAIYSTLINPESDENRSLLTPHLVELLHVQGVPSYLLLMFLMKNQKSLALKDETIARIIDLIVVFFVRRNVTDIPGTRDITRLLMSIVSDIEEGYLTGEAVYEHIRQTLQNNSASDEIFRLKLEGDIYKENVDAARYILCSLAQRRMTKETWTNLWSRSDKGIYIWTIEHIFPEGENIPQCWIDMIADGDKALANEYREQYVHKIGNLTMTGYNTELGNYSFEKKRDRKSKKDNKYVGYRNGLEINKELAEKDRWTVSDIQARTETLVEEILKMFKIKE